MLLTQSSGATESPKSNPDKKNHSRLLRTAVGNEPSVEIAVHNVSEVWLTVSNIGQFGTGYLGPILDPVTGAEAPSCIFPANSFINYLYVGAFWIGAVVGRDTLVSIGVDDYYDVVEFWPDSRSNMEQRSIQPSSPHFSEDARSEQDIIATYSDLLTDPRYVASDDVDNRPHVPLNIEITQRSYAWSYAYAEDFVLFDYSIRNVGRKKLRDVYMAIYVDGDVHHTSMFGPQGYGEDLCGFKRTHPTRISNCEFLDTINIAYITDNDGDPDDQGSFTPISARGAAGVRVVRTPSDSLSYSFNWWATNYDPGQDFGPRRAGTADDPFRDMNGILGTPMGDANKYYVMRHKEFDYDQMFTGKDHTADGWAPRPVNAQDIANGFDARYLLSFGPFEISPGEVLPVSFAWVLGANVHQQPFDFERYYDFNFPEIYYNTWDFSDLAKNSMWASWIYDNPGYDTDGDGWAGAYRTCVLESVLVCDTVIPDSIDCHYEYTKIERIPYKGDGVPDFIGASPPEPPDLRVHPRITRYNQGEIQIRWNGLKSETSKDRFSGMVDFEGYRVYHSLVRRKSDFSLAASYDKENYNQWAWSYFERRWILTGPPITLDYLRFLYGEDFNPLDYTSDKPLRLPNPGEDDSLYYFSSQDWNTSGLTDTMGIHKLYPDEPYPTTLDPDSAAFYYPDELTPEGYSKYFEYEYIIRDLLPCRLYYVSVSAFDYGSPGHGLESLESSPTLNAVAAYPQNEVFLVEEKKLDVIVYPNPYRIDGQYRNYGFEGLGREDMTDERVRAIHFTNLPHKCTIRIFSIDGDLVREIHHDCPSDNPTCMHEEWDLITRNTQAIVSGIYYYSVESEFGTQIGKIVIIM
jgi:hypothetical protein